MDSYIVVLVTSVFFSTLILNNEINKKKEESRRLFLEVLTYREFQSDVYTVYFFINKQPSLERYISLREGYYLEDKKCSPFSKLEYLECKNALQRLTRLLWRIFRIYNKEKRFLFFDVSEREVNKENLLSIIPEEMMKLIYLSVQRLQKVNYHVDNSNWSQCRPKYWEEIEEIYGFVPLPSSIFEGTSKIILMESNSI